MDLKRGSYFTLRPRRSDVSSFVPEWYAGNIYDMERALPHALTLSSPVSFTEPTEFDLFVSGDYEACLVRITSPYVSKFAVDQIIRRSTCVPEAKSTSTIECTCISNE